MARSFNGTSDVISIGTSTTLDQIQPQLYFVDGLGLRQGS